VASLLALDLALGPDLELALRRCADEGQAFCVLDQRVSSTRRAQELAALGATDVLDSTGRRSLGTGAPVDGEIALVMLTSGSSGAPKAVELTWDALRASATMTQESLGANAQAVWYPVLPANHIGGLAVVLRAVLGDARLLWGDPREVATAPRRGATHVAVVRSHLTQYDLGDFDTVLLGGARPPGRLAPNVVSTWGMTETGSGVVYNGRPLPGVELGVVDGELCVKSPTLFRSYRHGPRPRVVGPDASDEWFPTGDAADIVDGVVRVRGRMGYVINTGGEKVWPDDLESVLATVDGVRDVAVTSVPDERWGDRVIALVVSDDTNLAAALADVAQERIGPWARPKEVRYVVSIPRTANGKIRRDALIGATPRRVT
jgi:o-succinylbenzoate---CoA ligase